jgi:hypothetical protein
MIAIIAPGASDPQNAAPAESLLPQCEQKEFTARRPSLQQTKKPSCILHFRV